MSMKYFLERIRLLFLLSCYVFGLTIAYLHLVEPFYREYPDFEFSNLRVAEAGVLAFIIGMLLPLRWTRPSYFFYSILTLGVFFPMCVIFTFSSYNTLYLYIVAITLFGIGLAIRTPQIKIPRVINTWKISVVLLLLIIIITYSWLFWASRGHLTLNLNAVYKERLYVRYNVMSGPWGYTVSWVAKLFMPSLIGMTIYLRRYLITFLLFVISISLFFLTSHKSYLMYSLVPFIIFLLFKYKNQTSTAIKLTLSGLILSYMIWFLWGDFLIPSLLIQRPIFKHALLNFMYFEMFNDLPPVLLTTSKLFSWWADYPFDINPSFMIGKVVRDTEGTRSNTGFLGTGIVHFGVLGPLIFGLIISILLKVFDSLARRIPVWLACCIAFGPFSSMLIASDLIPALVTQGVLLCCLLAWVVEERFKSVL